MREKPNIIRCNVNFWGKLRIVSSPNLKKPKKAKVIVIVIVVQIMIDSECVVEEIAKRA